MEAHPLPLFKVNEPREPIDFLHIIINSLTLHFVGYTILCLPIRWGMPKLTHLPHGLTNLLFHVLCKLWGPRWFAHVLTIALMLSSMVSDGPSKTHPPKSSIQRIPTNLWKSRYSYVNRNVCVCVNIYVHLWSCVSTELHHYMREWVRTITRAYVVSMIRFPVTSNRLGCSGMRPFICFTLMQACTREWIKEHGINML